jgi:transposase
VLCPSHIVARHIKTVILMLVLLVENAIRPFVLGRRNWLFSGSPRGAHASATLYSVIETAKANGLEPYRYLRYLFTKLPLVRTRGEYRSLTPHLLDLRDFERFST